MAVPVIRAHQVSIIERILTDLLFFQVQRKFAKAASIPQLGILSLNLCHCGIHSVHLSRYPVAKYLFYRITICNIAEADRIVLDYCLVGINLLCQTQVTEYASRALLFYVIPMAAENLVLRYGNFIQIVAVLRIRRVFLPAGKSSCRTFHRPDPNSSDHIAFNQNIAKTGFLAPVCPNAPPA